MPYPKLEELRGIVPRQLKSNPNSRMLIFTQYRDTASRLVDVTANRPYANCVIHTLSNHKPVIL